MAVPALPKDYLILRVTWLCWLASLLGWYGLAAFCMYLLDLDGGRTAYITEWSVWGSNTSICVALLLALLAPILVGRFGSRRRTPTFRSEPGQWGRRDYRSPLPRKTIVDARAFSANVRLFSWRLAGAMSLSGVACVGLWSPVFWVQTGCVRFPNTFSFTEYTTYLGAMLGVVLIHAPTWRSVFRSPAPR